MIKPYRIHCSMPPAPEPISTVIRTSVFDSPRMFEEHTKTGEHQCKRVGKRERDREREREQRKRDEVMRTSHNTKTNGCKTTDLNWKCRQYTISIRPHSAKYKRFSIEMVFLLKRQKNLRTIFCMMIFQRNYKKETNHVLSYKMNLIYELHTSTIQSVLDKTKQNKNQLTAAK